MAQERKKRRIVLASVLKPVDDTRMFEKIGVSLAQTGDYEVCIVGFPSPSAPAHEGIQFFPMPAFKRLSFSRLLAKWRVFAKVRKLKPDILIFNTHELLIPSIVLKVFREVKIIYDVRENYFRNILYSESFPWIIRIPLALWVRFKEKLWAPAIHHFFLAEKAYEQEFKFYRGGWTVLENKAAAIPSTLTRTKEPGIDLLFSGTLAESTGVFRAIRLAKALHQVDPSVRLHLVGYASLTWVWEIIMNEIRGHDWIRVTGGNQLVPHPVIQQAILQADAGIMSYPDSHHTRNSNPTKLFEYLNAQLPILLEGHWPWISRYDSCQPFLIVDFDKPDYEAILKALRAPHFYAQPPGDVTWESEATKLLTALDKI